MIWNSIYGSKEARFEDPSDIRNKDEIIGSYTDIFKKDYNELG